MLGIHLIIPWFYALIFLLRSEHFSSWIIFALGIQLGYWFILLDVLFADEDVLKHFLKKRLSRKSISHLLKKPIPVKNRITRSPLFLLSLIPLSIFVLTSSGSLLGIGLVLGLMLRFWFDVILFINEKDKFEELFYWVKKVDFTKQRRQQYLLALSIIFIIITCLSLL